MAAILRHCLLTTGPTEEKTEELHRLVELQIPSMLKGFSLVGFSKQKLLCLKSKVEVWETMKTINFEVILFIFFWWKLFSSNIV